MIDWLIDSWSVTYLCVLQQLMVWADGEVADSKHCFWASGEDPQWGRVCVLREGGREGEEYIV